MYTVHTVRVLHRRNFEPFKPPGIRPVYRLRIGSRRPAEATSPTSFILEYQVLDTTILRTYMAGIKIDGWLPSFFFYSNGYGSNLEDPRKPFEEWIWGGAKRDCLPSMQWELCLTFFASCGHF